MNSWKEIAAVFVGICCFAFAVTFVLAWPFMWFWNYAVVAALSVAKPIGYWNAYVLMWFLSVFVLGNTKRS